MNSLRCSRKKPVASRRAKAKVKWLVQGTLYSDVIESRSVRGRRRSSKVAPQRRRACRKNEAQADRAAERLFKDEVRKMAATSACPKKSCSGSPFRGPDSPCVCWEKSTSERLALLRECDDIVVTEIKNAGLYTKIWQSFAVLLR